MAHTFERHAGVSPRRRNAAAALLAVALVTLSSWKDSPAQSPSDKRLEKQDSGVMPLARDLKITTFNPEEFVRSSLVVPAGSDGEAASMALGKGFDSITGAVGRLCIGVPGSTNLPMMTPESLSQVAGTARGNLDVFSSDHMDSRFQVDSAMVAARFDSGAMRGDGNYASYRARRTSTFSSTLHVVADAYTERRFLDTRNMQPIGQYGTGSFRQQCGDHVIVGAVMGARLHAKYDVFHHSTEERAVTEGSLSAAYTSGVQSAEGKAGFLKAIEQASATNRLHYKIVRQDGKAGAFIAPDKLMDAALDWRKHTPTDSVVVAWVLQPYSSLFDAPSGPILSESVSQFFNEQYRSLRRLAGLHSSLLVVLGKPGMLGYQNPNEVSDLIEEVEKDIAAVKDAVRRCGDGANPGNCVAPKLGLKKDLLLALPVGRKLRIQQLYDPLQSGDDPYINQLRVVELSGRAYSNCGDTFNDPFYPQVLWFQVERDGKRINVRGDQRLVLRPGEKLIGFDLSEPGIRHVPGRVRCDGDAGISFNYFVPLFPHHYSSAGALLKFGMQNLDTAFQQASPAAVK
jgi:hypothetical protein